MAKKNESAESATYEVEETSERTSKLKNLFKKRGMKLGASIAGGALALVAAFGIGVAAGDSFDTHRGQFSQGQFGPGHGPEHGPQHGPKGDHDGDFDGKPGRDGDRDFKMPQGDQLPQPTPAPETQQN